ncbi:MAG: histidine phosphatase family protein [Telluria sp.]
MGAIYLLRHGQASFDAADYDKLSALGARQARLLGHALSACVIREPLFIRGALQRHRETLHQCLDVIGVSHDVVVDPRWNEFDHQEIIRAAFPEYADASKLRATVLAAPDPHAAFQQIFEQAMARWASGLHDTEYAETWSAFRTRVRLALGDVSAALASGRAAIVSTSGGPIAAIVQHLLQIPDAQAVALNWVIVNASYTKLLAGRHAVRLSSFNVHQHLDLTGERLVTYR